jgi:hypothetical protein
MKLSWKVEAFTTISFSSWGHGKAGAGKDENGSSFDQKEGTSEKKKKKNNERGHLRGANLPTSKRDRSRRLDYQVFSSLFHCFGTG